MVNYESKEEKNMKLKKKMIIAIFFLLIMFLFSNNYSFAGTQRWNALDYDVTLNSDGSMDVIETWDTYISQTNTLFKDFEINTYDNYKITDVKISSVENGVERDLTQIYEEQYHVDSGCYYALQINSDVFEIAWNVGLDNSSANRVYKMYYTVENAVTVYNDCTELYWQFLSDENTMYGENITGRVKLPKAVSDIDSLRVWGHGSLSAEIRKKDNKTVEFSQQDLYSNEMFEIRIVTDENIYPNVTKILNKNMLENILIEEQEWADEANKQREDARNVTKIFAIIIISIIIVNLFVIFMCLKKCSKYKKIRKELKAKYENSYDEYNNYDIEYFRDIPYENTATPGKAMYLYLFKSNSVNMSSSISQVFSATILNLVLKGILYFEMENNNEVRIYISAGATSKLDTLGRDEKIVYELVSKAIWGKGYTTTKDFSRFASQEYDLVYTKLNRIDDVVAEELEDEYKISREIKDALKKWSRKQLIYVIIAIFSFMVINILPGLMIGMIMLAVSSRKNAICVSILTDTGKEEAKMWKGLKRYMEEYSLLNEKQAPDIVLWEKYLVYATAFGISEKVIKQLKLVHPEMFERYDDYDNNYAYWHMISSPRFNDNFFNNFSRDLGKVYSRAASAYSAAHSSDSSGSGGGGGFSSGGGRRRRRWKLWRSIKLIYISKYYV